MNQCHCSTASIEYSQCLARCRSPELPSKPLPFIGLYIATASLLCSIAVSADLFHGVRQNEPWIPSKYFSMNAATLILLAVVVKLPVDITTEMFSNNDVMTKWGGIIVITVAITTFMPSVAVMTRKDVWQNMVALGILITTLSVNVIMQIFTSMALPLNYAESLLVLFFQFLFLISSAVSASETKSYLDLKYQKLHRQIPRVGLETKERFCVKNLRKFVQFYWVMAKTGSPVFVMARSIICLAASIVPFFASLSYVLEIFLSFPPQLGTEGDTDYHWSIPLILVTQLLLSIGCLATLLLRCNFVISSFSKKACVNHFRYMCRIEEYWTKGLKQLKHRPLMCHITNHTYRKVVEAVKIFVLNICITMQIIIVVVSKLVVLLTYFILVPLYFCFLHLWIKICSTNNQNELESDSEIAMELSELKCYVLLLEGELELPQRILKGLCTALDRVIQMGAKQQKGHLLELISGNFFNLNSLLEFDNDEVESLHSEEPPRSWSLSIVNLTSIIVALPTIKNDEKIKLLQSVDEGIFYMRFIEKNLDLKKKLEHVGKAADMVWNGVELKYEWLEKDIQGKTVQGKNSKGVLQHLAKISKGIVMGFKVNKRSSLMENPLHWPKKVIVANSMYRVSQTLLLQCDNGTLQSDEQVFNKIVKMIADIVLVCLTNLPLAISSKCYTSTIEEREKSVKQAARLLGASKNILQFLNQQIDLPILQDGDGAPYLDEWRAFIKKQNQMSPTVANHDSPVPAYNKLRSSKSI